MARYRVGVFAIEGDWSPKLTDRLTIEPLLAFMRSSRSVDVVHRRVGTPEAFADVAGRWHQKQYRRYILGWFALHGSPGAVHFGRRRVLTLEQMGDLLEDRAKGKFIYFGSCETLRVPRGEIESFRQRTGARAVAGYVREVDWFESAAFEILLLDAFTWYRRSDAIERFLREKHSGLAKRVGFKMYYGT